jgi:hypothetical protein
MKNNDNGPSWEGEKKSYSTTHKGGIFPQNWAKACIKITVIKDAYLLHLNSSCTY